MPAAAARAEHLSKRFGDTLAVDGVSFEIAPGQLVGFLGPNGAGKTTTLRMLAGLFAPTAGKASVAGLDSVSDSLALRGAIGYLPEHNPLYHEMRVEEYLCYCARLRRVPRSRRAAAMDRAIETCSLAEARRRPIGELSKGFRQRVGLAAAILHDPPLLILDEPTSGLDPTQIIEARRILRALAGERTILLSTHLLTEVERMCDRALVFVGGRLCADGAPEALAARAAGRGARLVLEAQVGAGREAGLLEALHFAGSRHAEIAARESGGWVRVVAEAPEDGASHGGRTLEAATPHHDHRAALESVARACAAKGILLRELRVDAGGSFEAAIARLLESPSQEQGGAPR